LFSSPIALIKTARIMLKRIYKSEHLCAILEGKGNTLSFASTLNVVLDFTKISLMKLE
jgi:hypothetical protein